MSGIAGWLDGSQRIGGLVGGIILDGAQCLFALLSPVKDVRRAVVPLTGGKGGGGGGSSTAYPWRGALWSEKYEE
eukprot:gene24813-biopygen2945